jgi:hypothetical protein
MRKKLQDIIKATLESDYPNFLILLSAEAGVKAHKVYFNAKVK